MKWQLESKLVGWDLVWRGFSIDETLEDRFDEIWQQIHEEFVERFSGRKLIDEEIVTTIRALFRKAGCDPTRYRPSSEALARRVLGGGTLPRINSFVDVNNLLSIRLMAPCCVIDAEKVSPPFVLRAGNEGERMMSMRGDFNLKGKVLIEDSRGPFGTPITDSERVKVGDDTQHAWMVIYVPEDFGGGKKVDDALVDILPWAPLVRDKGIPVS